MKFEEIIGNEIAKEELENFLKQEKIVHSYLFLGIEGIGKKEIAKEFARKILCMDSAKEECQCLSCKSFANYNHPDFFFINEEETTIKIEVIREMVSKVVEKPIRSKRKVFMINDADKMTKEAQNCLLKTLEEPPEYICIILIATNESLLLNTIKSRCLKIQFSKIKDEEIKQFLSQKMEMNAIDENMIKIANGSIGRALKLCQDVTMYQSIQELIEKLKTEDIIHLLQKKNQIFDKEKILYILEYMQLLLLQKSHQDKQYLNCVLFANEAIQRLQVNCNYDMVIDNFIFSSWKEFN